MQKQERWTARLTEAGKDASAGSFDPSRFISGIEIGEIGHQARLSRSNARQPISCR